jgi:2-oxoglutarate dehydrogenase E2 component (dihydrolipoamide succinyltransferase)
MERVTMPQLGETVTEGTVVRWLKAEGDEIAVDEALFDVSTDKVDAEVPSAYAGVVRALLVGEGDTVPIGTPVALIGATADEPLPEEGGGDAPPPPPTTPERVAAPGRVADAPSTNGRARWTSGSRSGGAAVLTPVVRQLLDDHGLDAAQVTGSGRDGRITRADVLAAAARGPGSAATAAAAAAPDRPRVEPGPDDDVVPFTRARANTAAAMSRSRAIAAHTLVTTEVDYTAVERARRVLGLTYLPFVARALVDAVPSHPHVNASVGDDCLVVHRTVHLGIAVDLDREVLVVPVIRGAADLRLPALADRLRDVADRARANRLTLTELDGATITLTNVGSYGTVSSAPIIPVPQVAILSSDGVRMRPVARPGPDGEWAVAIHPVGNLSLSFDHRAVDGAYAAAFLAEVRDLLERRDWTAEARR